MNVNILLIFLSCLGANTLMNEALGQDRVHDWGSELTALCAWEPRHMLFISHTGDGDLCSVTQHSDKYVSSVSALFNLSGHSVNIRSHINQLFKPRVTWPRKSSPLVTCLFLKKFMRTSTYKNDTQFRVSRFVLQLWYSARVSGFHSSSFLPPVLLRRDVYMERGHQDAERSILSHIINSETVRFH